MKRSRVIAGAAAAAVVLVLGGAGLAAADFAGPRGPGMHVGGPGAGAHGHAMTVRSEADYLAQMVPHHEEAVAAAEQLARSDRPEMRRLGAEIVRTQSAEIERMERWLQRWHPAQEAASYDPMMRDLSELSGDDLDRAFLEDMVPHHMGAVMMSRQLVLRDLVEHPQVGSFARQVAETQHAEIFQMQEWLATWLDARPGTGTGPMTGRGPGMHHGHGPGHS